jgi:hypothetical protein
VRGTTLPPSICMGAFSVALMWTVNFVSGPSDSFSG